MLSIGDFARTGSVSIRMLRHYDAIGLLRPAHIDPSSGYRHYTADQLTRLNRIIALKELGFTLRQVADLLDAQVDAAELRGMLRLRQVELQEELAAGAARLAQVEVRLRTIESEGRMEACDIVVKSLPAVRVAELTAIASDFTPAAIGPVIQPLFEELCRRLEAAGVAITGPTIAHYGHAADGDGSVVVHAAAPVDLREREGHDFAVVDLPAVEQAATVVHRGPMAEVMPAVQALSRWVEGSGGYRAVGASRELYLSCEGGQEHWVTEIQEPLTRA
ncbi:MerR family transcriptional regulator [Streptomyces sp. 549]|uniref:MerR family transcriptional regulator n=1 Tax=Streptomyces sp. 549 TaxID=3049076 RepID=UPI0024C23C8E|nr:MerR family transcriptional regulator [Streptomyces sp. 549]MDK1472486.1 MerR family transcriptional regulator [Streptomyces sp. 549]